MPFCCKLSTSCQLIVLNPSTNLRVVLREQIRAFMAVFKIPERIPSIAEADLQTNVHLKFVYVEALLILEVFNICEWLDSWMNRRIGFSFSFSEKIISRWTHLLFFFWSIFN